MVDDWALLFSEVEVYGEPVPLPQPVDSVLVSQGKTVYGSPSDTTGDRCGRRGFGFTAPCVASRVTDGDVSKDLAFV